MQMGQWPTATHQSDDLCFWEAAMEPRSKRYVCGQSLKGGLGDLQTSLSQTGSVRRNGPDFQQTITHL